MVRKPPSTKDFADVFDGHADIGDQIRARGPPARGAVFWPGEGNLGQVEQEVLHLVRESGQWAFLFDRAAAWSRLRKFIFELYEDGDPSREDLEAAFGDLIHEMRPPLTEYLVVVGLHGIKLPRQRLVIGGVRLGRISRVLSNKELRSLSAMPEGLRDPFWARVVVEAPNRDAALSRADALIEEALDLLLSGWPRTRFNHGQPRVVAIGESYAVFPVGDPARSEAVWSRRRRENRDGFRYEAPAQLWRMDQEDRWKAHPLAWNRVEATSVADLLRRSYARIGRAVRRLGDANDCLVNAVSALEPMLSRSDDTGKERMVVRALAVAVDTRAAIPSPLEIVADYNARNAVLHDGEVLGWVEKDQRDAVRRWYTLVDVLAHVTVARKPQDTDDLLKKVMTQRNVKKLTEVIDDEIADLSVARDEVESGFMKGVISDQFDQWRRFKRALNKEARRLNLPFVPPAT